LLENGDSIWARINASSFDESIYFSGTGSSKNNFLIESMLNERNDDNYLSTKYSSNSNAFNLIIDSLIIKQKNSWIKMDSLNNLSKIAQKITQASYIYPYATKRERYALLRGTNWSKKEDSIFFDYRKYLNYGDNDLAFFNPYINYTINYINEKALDSGQLYFNEKSLTKFNIKRLKMIDKLISGDLLRNNLARAIAFEEILNFDNHVNHNEFLEIYSKINTSKNYISEVLEMHSDITKMGYGKRLPRIQLKNTKGKLTNSSQILNGKPTVFYFWSQTQMNHYRNTMNKVFILQKKYPNYRFVGICIQPFNTMISKVLNMMKINLENQFSILNFERVSKKWVLTLLNKAIITDSSGRIKQGFANFSEENFEENL
tara:strand:- start:171 stop:1292 length:1122 start_codon:yes stop_codon:yes gene_type:complete